MKRFFTCAMISVISVSILFPNPRPIRAMSEGLDQILPAVTSTLAVQGYADVVLDYFNSGAGVYYDGTPIPAPYGGTLPTAGTACPVQFPIPVSLDVVLGGDPGPTGCIDVLSLPTGSYITVGFLDEIVMDRPGPDIFINVPAGPEEKAEVWVSSNYTDFILLGIAVEPMTGGTLGFDLAVVNFTDPVVAVKIVGLDLGGGSPGFDVMNVLVARSQEFTVNFTTFIPGNNLNTGISCKARFQQSRPQSLFVRLDDREFDPDQPNSSTYRTRQLVTVITDETVDPDGLKEGTEFNDAHPTKTYAGDALPFIDDSDDDATLRDCHLLDNIASPIKDMHIDVTRIGPNTIEVHLFGDAGTGFPMRFIRPAPISWDIILDIDTSGDRPTVAYSVAHDGFPSYEIFVNDYPIYHYSVSPPSFPPWGMKALYPPLDISNEGIVELPN